MRNILTIAGKEIRAYFASPIAYMLMALFALVSGFFFYLFTSGFIQYSIQAAGRGQTVNVNEMVVAPVLENATIIGLFLIPLIAMRLFAEEKRTGTIELLLTSPLRDWEIVLGKWIGGMAMYTCMIAMSAINIALLFLWGSPEWRSVLTGYLGLLLQGGTIMAIGCLISTFTRNQIIAGATTFLLCLLLWILKAVSQFNDAAWAQAVAYCSILAHFEPFSKGVIDTKDLVYYATAIFLGLFLTTRSLESLRWRA